MSDQNKKTNKKIFGRGRGIAVRSEGPWSRSKQVEETKDVRPPKKEVSLDDQFVLNESSFPPLPGSDKSDKIVGLDEVKSSLSPLAVEFVPKATNMNPEAEDFVPTSTFTNYDEPINNSSMTSTYDVSDTDAILACLEETVNFCYMKLLETPASYDELVGVVTPHFIRYMENPDLPLAIVQSLYDYAVQDTSFAYFAVRILVHLIHMTCTEDNRQLRNTLLRFIQEEMQITENSRLKNAEISCLSNIQPFLMFLSELFIQLEVGPGIRIRVIGSALVEILRKLVTTAHFPLKERIKLIVNIVKLTGLSLDQDDSTWLDSLFTELDFILQEESSNLDDPTVQFINDIIVLRNLNWGVEPTLESCVNNDDFQIPSSGDVTFSNDNPAIYSTMGSSSGVFYGPDGNPIDYEEQLFLELETDALTHLTIEDQDAPSPASIEGFDEAYEEFLKTVPGHSTQSDVN